MAFDVQASPLKNRLYVRVSGFLGDDEAERAAESVLKELAKLKPGFDVIVDMQGYKPGSAQVAEHLMRVQRAYKQHKVHRIVRIVGDSVLGKMQMNRTANEVGGLPSEVAGSREEAERMLDSH